MLIKFGFLSGNSQANPSSIKQSSVVKDFVGSCNKYDCKNENMAEFFERIERKFSIEFTTVENKINILDMLLPGHFFQPYEPNKTHNEQYELYKKRALVKARCTSIDQLYKVVNCSFTIHDSFDSIFSRLKYLISKSKESFPGSSE